MASRQELSDFLSSVERRAFKQAVFAVRDDDTALDLVQDAMMRLSERYGDKPAEELPMLFQRILQNRIHDHFRRNKVRNFWVTLWSALRGPPGEADDDFDPLESFEAEEGSQAAESTEDRVASEQTVRIIEQEIERLPTRQREAFLLRYWEEMNLSETAVAMGCTEGSVKTHCSRAVQALSKALRAKGFNT